MSGWSHLWPARTSPENETPQKKRHWSHVIFTVGRETVKSGFVDSEWRKWGLEGWSNVPNQPDCVSGKNPVPWTLCSIFFPLMPENPLLECTVLLELDYQHAWGCSRRVPDLCSLLRCRYTEHVWRPNSLSQPKISLHEESRILQHNSTQGRVD